MRIAMFGAGGVGGYFGACLARAGEHVVFIARGDHLAAMKRHGLRITSPKGDFTVPEVEASNRPTEVDPVDVVFVAVKTWQLSEAAGAMQPLFGADTFVVPVLNGIEAYAELASVLGANRVLKGLTKIMSYIAEPGHIHHVGVEPSLSFGEPDNTTSERTTKLRDALERAGVHAEVPADIDVALWEKFLFVVSTGGVGAVTRSPVGTVRDIPETRAMLETAMTEIYDVGRARGVNLPDGLVPRAMAFFDTLPVNGTASLQRDIVKGRRSELDAWNGAVVRLGQEIGVPTPTHEYIYGTLLPLELRARGEA